MVLFQRTFLRLNFDTKWREKFKKITTIEHQPLNPELHTMSSHHFVRENQEPGLYIDEWFFNAPELLEQLSQWAPKIIVHERVLNEVLDTGTKIDVVLYVKDKELVEEKTRFQFPIELAEAKQSFEANIQFIEQHYINRIHIISTKTPEEITFETEAKLTFFNTTNSFFKIETGFEKWMAKAARFEIIENSLKQQFEGNDTLFRYEGKTAFFVEKI